MRNVPFGTKISLDERERERETNRFEVINF